MSPVSSCLDRKGCKDRQRAGYPIPRSEVRPTRRHDDFSRHSQIVPVTIAWPVFSSSSTLIPPL